MHRSSCLWEFEARPRLIHTVGLSQPQSARSCSHGPHLSTTSCVSSLPSFLPHLARYKASESSSANSANRKMGIIFGKIDVETPKYELLHSCPDYDIRKYSPSVVAQVSYYPSQFRDNPDGGFSILANYIGALGRPQNKKPEKIAMTAPVITRTGEDSGEKIAMTAPVITREGGGGGGGGEERMVTMQFVLPAKYRRAEDAPAPTDARVIVREEGERKYGVARFSGVATDEVVKEKVGKLREWLERDGHRIVGEYLLARYNPPWTLPHFRTNEIMIPVE